MMMEYITLAGFVLAVFGTGVAVGKMVEKIERLDRKREDEEHMNTSKNNRQQFPDHSSCFCLNSIRGQPSIGSTILYKYITILYENIQGENTYYCNAASWAFKAAICESLSASCTA